MHLEFCLFGGFAAHVQSPHPRPLRITARKGRALLAYLAMQPQHRASREQLASLLWGDRTDAEARHNLRQCLVLLRRELGSDALTVTGEEISLDGQRLVVDAVAFQTLADSNDIETLARAAALYRGELLAGLSLNVEPFDEWLRGERKRLETTAVRVFEQTAKLQSDAGDGAAAIAAAERLVACDPLREDWQRLLIELYARHRSPAAALAHAKNLAELLRRELDVAPASETCALVEEIRAANVAAAAADEPVEIATEVSVRIDVPDKKEAAANGPKSDDLADAPEDGAQVTPETPRPANAKWQFPLARPQIGALIAGIAAIALVVAFVGEPAQSPQSLHSSPKPATAPASAEQIPTTTLSSPKVAAADSYNSRLFNVAVLPFVVEGSENDKIRGVADLIAAHLADYLSRTRPIRTASWHASRQYRSEPHDLAAIGASLDTRYVIEGRVHRNGSVLRIGVTLVDTLNSAQIWSDRFEHVPVDGSVEPDEIARALARRVRIKVVEALGRGDNKNRQHGTTVQQLVVIGWAAYSQSISSGSAGPAESYFSQVLARDPQNLSAQTGIGAYHATLAAFYLDADRASHIALAERLLADTVRIAPHVMGPVFHFGRVQKLRGNLMEARARFEEAIELNPSFAPAYAELGHVVALMGRLDEGLEQIHYAMRLSPRDPALPIWSMFAGHIALEQGKDRVATEWLERAVALSPKNPLCRLYLAAAYALGDKAAGAAEQIAKAQEIAPWLTRDWVLKRYTGRSRASQKIQRLLSGINTAFAKL